MHIEYQYVQEIEYNEHFVHSIPGPHLPRRLVDNPNYFDFWMRKYLFNWAPLSRLTSHPYFLAYLHYGTASPGLIYLILSYLGLGLRRSPHIEITANVPKNMSRYIVKSTYFIFNEIRF